MSCWNANSPLAGDGTAARPAASATMFTNAKFGPTSGRVICWAAMSLVNTEASAILALVTDASATRASLVAPSGVTASVFMPAPDSTSPLLVTAPSVWCTVLFASSAWVAEKMCCTCAPALCAEAGGPSAPRLRPLRLRPTRVATRIFSSLDCSGSITIQNGPMPPSGQPELEAISAVLDVAVMSAVRIVAAAPPRMSYRENGTVDSLVDERRARARSALPVRPARPTVRTNVGVLRRVLMAAGAMSLGSLACAVHLADRAAAHILKPRDRLKVIGPHATTIPTEVVDLVALGNRADEVLIREAVREVGPLTVPDHRIAIGNVGTVPLPAAIATLHACLIAVEGGSADHHQFMSLSVTISVPSKLPWARRAPTCSYGCHLRSSTMTFQVSSRSWASTISREVHRSRSSRRSFTAL